MSTPNAQHTPGPWFVADPMHADRSCDAISAPSWAGLAQVVVEVNRRHSREGAANANLIASAPALLAALKDVLPAYRLAMFALGRDPDAFEASAEVVAARAAIAQAEGGAK